MTTGTMVVAGVAMPACRRRHARAGKVAVGTVGAVVVIVIVVVVVGHDAHYRAGVA